MMMVQDLLRREESPICAVVLAAGASRRMGTPKQLLEIAGETLVARACRSVLDAGIDKVFAVAGEHVDEISSCTRDLGVYAVYNGCWQTGQASSVRMAASLAESIGSRYLLVLPTDMPHLSFMHIGSLMRAALESGVPVVASRSPENRPMCPCVFRSDTFCELGKLRGDEGAIKAVRSGGFGEVPLIAFPTEIEAVDVDTPEEFALAKDAIERNLELIAG